MGMLDTVDNVKARLNITVDDFDVFLENQITIVSDAIEGYLRRKVKAATFTQHFYNTDYRRSMMVELFGFPVASVASITEDGTLLDAANYRLHKPTGRIVRLDNTPFFGAKETVIIYSAGLAAVPSPILSVLDSCVQERYNKKTSGVDLNFGSDVQRIAIPGAISIDFDYSMHNNDRSTTFGVILGNNSNILDIYRSDRAVLGNSKLVYIDEYPEGNP